MPKGTLLADVQSLFNNRRLSDLTFLVENKPIYVNRAIVACRCPQLFSMLYGGMKESQQDTIRIPEMRYETFSYFLEFLYTDDVPSHLSPESYMELLMVGEQYTMDRLKAMCSLKLKQSISVDKVSTLLLTAHRHNSQPLKELCLQFIAEHRKEVVQCEDFKVLALEPELLLEVTIKISLAS
jgi:hypothetical protein